MKFLNIFGLFSTSFMKDLQPAGFCKLPKSAELLAASPEVEMQTPFSEK